MPRKNHVILALLVLLAGALACANPLGGTGPAQAPNVETVVAATLRALTAQVEQPLATLPPADESLLPHSIYFLNNDAAGLVQVYRLARDGQTLTQLTFEPANVDEYDVALADGSVAYVTNNQIFTINADGSSRSLVVDGGPIDPNNSFITRIRTPLWSPDAQTITYGQYGISVYSILSGQSTLLYANQLSTENGFTFGEVYIPIRFSPDGSRLLISMVPLASDGGALGVFSPAQQGLVRLSGVNHTICCSLRWTADNNALYGAYAAFNPFASPGLWRVDASSGTVTDLIPAFSQNDTVLNFAAEPFLAPDGQLYFFYSTQPYAQQEEISRVSLQLVRSAVDGVTNRTVLLPGLFTTLNEALWAPDASFVITASGPIADVLQGGLLEMYYTDGQRAMIPLAPFGYDLKWGP